MGTNNKLNNALAAIMALCAYKVDRKKLGTLNIQEVMEIRKKNNEQAEAERAAKNDRKRPRRPEGEQSSGAPGRGGNNNRRGPQKK